MHILIPLLILGGLGLLFGAGLALASQKFLITVDPRIEKIYAKLPGANCGACGMAGCMGFAEGLIKGGYTVDKCVISQEGVRQEIAEILGVEAKTKIKQVAVLHCHGGNQRAKDKFNYSGIKDCVSANLVMLGFKACIWGCIGYKTCVKLCPFGAIRMNKENLPVIDRNKCTACGKCVSGCPKKLFSLVPADRNYAVRCKSLNLGKKVTEVCSVGCISCRKCEKACPKGAIKLIDNLAVIDYSLCDNRGECFKVCPTKTIAKHEKNDWITN